MKTKRETQQCKAFAIRALRSDSEMLHLTRQRDRLGHHWGHRWEGGGHSSTSTQHFNAQSNQNTGFNFRLMAVTGPEKNTSYFRGASFLQLLSCFLFCHFAFRFSGLGEQYFSINIGILNLPYNFRNYSGI